MDRGEPDRYGRFPCGCVRARDFKGYGVTQLCGKHFYELSRPSKES